MSPRSPVVPIGVLLLCLVQLVLAGGKAASTRVENLPNPRGAEAATGRRVVHFVHPSETPARIWELTFERPAVGPTDLRTDARLRVQLASEGKTRLLVVRPFASEPSRRAALADVLSGRGRLQLVADRTWVDLGPLPPAGAPLRVQVTGLLPAPFGFAELNEPADPLFQSVEALPRDGPGGVPRRIFPRYRLRVSEPVAPAETLSRFFFFLAVSPVLAAAGVVASLLLVAGWWLLGRERTTAAVCCLVPAVTLLHAVCLPPLQAADETSHAATIERIVFPAPGLKWDDFPKSVAVAADALEQDRVQFHPDEPLPLAGVEARARLRELLRADLRKEAREAAPAPVKAYVQEADPRAPLFFRPWTGLVPFLQGRSLADRLSLYRLLSTLSGLALFCGGALLLRRTAIPSGVVLAYGLPWLVPYMVIAVAGTTNYAPAIGLGSLLAACVVSLILGEREERKWLPAGVLVLGSWAGILLWPDFVFLAPVATSLALAGIIWKGIARLGPVPRRFVGALALLLLAAAVGGLFYRLPGVKVATIGTRMPLALPAPDDPLASTIALVVAVPLLLASLAAWALVRLPKTAGHRRDLTARLAVFAPAILLMLAFLLTPHAVVPYENTRLPYGTFALAHVRAFVSSAFGWDQDTLSWKLYVGVGGWHDVFYPDVIYALAKWAFILLLIGLPAVLLGEGTPRATAAALVLAAGFGASFSVMTLTLRYFQPGNAWGRFMLPWLPLVLTPLLVPFTTKPKAGLVTTLLRAGVLVQIWTAVSVLGTRYLFGQG